MTGGVVTGIFGGPPCQGFSEIGRRDVLDPRRELVGHFFRVIREVLPAFFIMENVRGLGVGSARELLDQSIKSLGGYYSVTEPLILDAADFGAATKRRRLFVVGVHKDSGVALGREQIERQCKFPATVKQAIFDLRQSVATHEDSDGFDHWKIIGKGRPSEYSKALRNSTGTFTGHRITVHRTEIARRFAKVEQGGIDAIGRHVRLTWDGQCPTIRAGTGPDKGSRQAVRPLHPDEDRVITVREAARLQGFPDDYFFHPTLWHSFRMIGNSVSPFMSVAIFKAMKRHLKL